MVEHIISLDLYSHSVWALPISRKVAALTYLIRYKNIPNQAPSWILSAIGRFSILLSLLINSHAPGIDKV